jgi:hypothetical protein
LARTGKAFCRRFYAIFPPSSGYTAMPILCVARWRSARGMIEWLCIQKRRNPDNPIIRYCRATACSSHYYAYAENSTLHTGGGLPPQRLCGESLLHIAPFGPCPYVFEILPALQFVLWTCAFCSEDGASVCFQWARRSRKTTYVAASAGWLFCNLMVHPLLGEEGFTSPTR